MKTRYRLIRRGVRNGGFYCVDTKTGKRTSLRTDDEDAGVNEFAVPVTSGLMNDIVFQDLKPTTRSASACWRDDGADSGMDAEPAKPRTNRKVTMETARPIRRPSIKRIARHFKQSAFTRKAVGLSTDQYD